MEIQYHGANCVKLLTKKATITVDDNLIELGQKAVGRADEVMLYTFKPQQTNKNAKIVIDTPGEYEISEVSIQGIPARAHTDEPKDMNATIFKIIAGDVRVGVLGHIYPDLTDDQLEALGAIDVLIVPVGGHGYTLDAVEALKLIKKIEPKIVIPTHYADKRLKYPIPQQELSEALKDLAMEPKETISKLKIKPADLTEGAQLIVLERQ